MAARTALGGGGVNCTPLGKVPPCVKASQAGAPAGAGAAVAPGLGLMKDAQSPAGANE